MRGLLLLLVVSCALLVDTTVSTSSMCYTFKTQQRSVQVAATSTVLARVLYCTMYRCNPVGSHMTPRRAGKDQVMTSKGKVEVYVV